MTGTSHPQPFFSEIERLLHEKKYEDAKVFLGDRLDQRPGDRESRLYFLLINVTLYGALAYEDDIYRLRGLLNLSDTEREIIRRLFLLAFESAEKDGREKQAWNYQRLLRRLLLNQPLDHSALKSGGAALPANDTRVAERTASASTTVGGPAPNRFSRFRSGLSLIAKTTTSVKLAGVLALIGLLIAPILYSWLTHDQPADDVTDYRMATPQRPVSGNSVLVSDTITVSGQTDSASKRSEAIQLMVVKQLSKFRQIYDKWIQKNPNLMGSLLVKIKLDAVGNTIKVEEVASRLSDSGFRNTVLEELRKWKFPGVNRGGTEFTIPLLFIPEDMAPAAIARWERTLKPSFTRAKATAPATADAGANKKLEDPGAYMIPWNFVLLVIAILFWAISLFLVAEAAKIQKWGLGEQANVLDPHSWVDISQLLSCLVVLLWFGRALFATQPGQDPFHFLFQLLVKPELIMPGILLAVFPPLIVGMVKLITTLGITGTESKNAVDRRNRLWVHAVFIALHLIVAVGAATVLAI